MLTEYLSALFFIFVAEMGDKTQILAMMFATKYKINKVLLGILIGSFLNHGLAVLLGSLVGNVIDTSILQMVAGGAFIAFALWTLISRDNEEEEGPKAKSKGAIITVATAFFVGELGDKTQLTAITLSVDAIYPLIILAGTVSGMLVTSSIGIYVGSKLGDKIPELLIKLLSGSVFLTFGILKLVGATPEKWINPITVSIFAISIGISVFNLIRLSYNGVKSGELTPYRRAASMLHDYVNNSHQFVDELCLTQLHCGRCDNEKCGIGLIRHIINEMKAGELDHPHNEEFKELVLIEDKFSQTKLVHMLTLNLKFLMEYQKKDIQYEEIQKIRKVIEVLLMGKWVEFDHDLEAYILAIKAIDRAVGEKVETECK